MDKEQQVQHVPVSHYKKAETILRAQERIRWRRNVIAFLDSFCFAVQLCVEFVDGCHPGQVPFAKEICDITWTSSAKCDRNTVILTSSGLNKTFKWADVQYKESWVPTPLSVMKQPQGLAWTGLTSKRVLVVKQWALHIQQKTPGACVAKTEISEAGSWLGSCDQTVSSVSEV